MKNLLSSMISFMLPFLFFSFGCNTIAYSYPKTPKKLIDKNLSLLNKILEDYHLTYLFKDSFFIENNNQIWFFFPKNLSKTEEKALTNISMIFSEKTAINIFFVTGHKNDIEKLSSSFHPFHSRYKIKQKHFSLSLKKRFVLSWILRNMSFLIFGYCFYSIPYFVNQDGFLCLLLDRDFKKDKSYSDIAAIEKKEKIFKKQLTILLQDYFFRGFIIYTHRDIFHLKKQESLMH